jgi:predicted transcriptional regulator
MPEPRPLYRVYETGFFPDRHGGRAVYVVEGEKCCEAMRERLGLFAITSSGGSKAASKSDWRPLAGRDVVILPDNDDAGREYAAEVAAILHELDPPATVRVVELDGLEHKGDVADWSLGCETDDARQALREKIERLADETEPLKPKAATASTTPATPKAASTSTAIEAWRPFPVAALPKAVSALVEESARSIGCDEAFVALPLLAVLGSAIGTTRRVELKPGWRALPVVWPVSVAESGSQKSPAADVSLDHVRDREDRLHEEYLSTLSTYEIEVEDYEKCRSTWRHAKKSDEPPPKRPREPIQQRVLVEDATIEALVSALADNPRGLLVATDELSGWLGGMGRYNGTATADEAFFLKAFSGRSHNVSRRTGRSVHIRQAAVWLTGTIQPGVLRRALGVERRESGLLARLLLAQPPRRPKRWTTDSIGWTTRENFVSVLDGLYGLEHELAGGRHESRIVRLSRDAERLFVEFFVQHDAEAIQHSGDLAAAWSKLEETAGRLALILHETRLAAGEQTSTDEIDAATMAAAIELVSWFKYETRRVYAILAESEIDRAIRQADDRLAAWIERQGGSVAVRDVIAGCRWITDADEAEEALGRLVAAGRGRWIDKPTTGQGGRPTRLFSLDVEAASAQPPKPPALGGSADADACRGAESAIGADEEYVEL